MPIDSNRRKKVYQLVPEGALVTRIWLQQNDLSDHAIDNLLKSKQLEAVHKGIYKREGSVVEWGDVVYFLQRMCMTDLTIGGISALELQRLAHYIPMSGNSTIHLYGQHSLPDWVNLLTADARFQKHSAGNLLGKGFTPEQTSELNEFTRILNWKTSGDGLRIASPERAILELINEVPERISFEHAEELMQGLNTLSPRSLQKLLELCGNIKVRRLFLWYAERQNHPWLSKLNVDRIDLGKGNRMIVKGGKLNKKYQITVPETYE